jgi:hypothetical protein
VFVDGLEATQHFLEPVGADRDHRRQSGDGFHRIAAADAVPEFEHVAGVDAKFANPAVLVEIATKCGATAFSLSFMPASSQSRALRALVMVSSVVKVFEEIMNSVSAGSRSPTASARSVQ